MPQLTVVERRRVWAASIAITVLFAVLAYAMQPGRFISILNGAYLGSTVAFIVAFWPIVRDALFRRGHYDRVDQASIGIFLIWMAYNIGVGLSIYVRSSSWGASAYLASAVSRYIAIVGTCLLILAPDLGRNTFYGRDRKLLIGSVAAGMLIALTAILVQENKVLVE